MKRVHKAIISFGIVAILASGSSSVFARTEIAKEHAVSGAVVQIDRNARIITVREQATGAEIQVRVPAGSIFRTNQVGLSAASFEQLLPGMFVRDVRVQ